MEKRRAREDAEDGKDERQVVLIKKMKGLNIPTEPPRRPVGRGRGRIRPPGQEQPGLPSRSLDVRKPETSGSESVGVGASKSGRHQDCYGSGGSGQKRPTSSPVQLSPELTTKYSSIRDASPARSESPDVVIVEEHFPGRASAHGVASASGSAVADIIPVVQPVSPPSIRAAPRPSYSSAGKRRIQIVTNFFRLRCNLKSVYHYDVVILPRDRRAGRDDGPKPPGKVVSHNVVYKWTCQYHLEEYSPVYDGMKNLYTCKPLPFGEETEFEIIVVAAGDRKKRFTLTVKPVVKKRTRNNAVDMTSVMRYAERKTAAMPNEARTVLEAILSYRRPDFPQIAMRNSFYFTDQVERRFNLGFGCEMWSGYSQSIRFTGQGAAIVINTAAAAFHKSGPVVDVMSDVLRKDVRKDALNRRDVERLSRKLGSVNVCVTHQKQRRKYRIECFTETPASHLRFPLDDGREVSVKDFFESRYGLRLRYPHLACIKMCSSRNSQVFLPPEVCEILPNQRVRGKLDEKLAANMIRQTALPPEKKFEQIDKDARSVCHTSAGPMKQYGIQLSLQPVETTARVLEQPSVQYRSKTCSLKDNGVWDMRDRSFRSSASARKPVLVSFASSDVRMLERFADILCSAGRSAGLEMSKPRIKCYGDRDSTETVIEEASKSQADLILVVLSKMDRYHSYEEVKFFADVKFGVVSQCLNEEVVRRTCDRSDTRTAFNICLKINAKLGGVNHEVTEWPMALRKEGVIVMGADVIHHLGDDFPSIAALVGCHDPSVFKYAVSCRAQANPKSRKSQEIILDLENMVKSVLKSYYKQNARQKPQKILFYRDGVSEGQFQQVLDTEIPMIKKACRSLQEDYMPPITFVIVQKRHPVRFRPKYKQDGVGRGANVPPGTIADKDIVDPQLYDFYLCSHEGIQGTSKPTRYTVLFDENVVKADVMESLTYYLCHVFARCNRSISIPAPVKYADLLCTRASDYVKVILKRRQFMPQSCGNGEIPEEIRDVMNSIERLPRSMFFV